MSRRVALALLALAGPGTLALAQDAGRAPSFGTVTLSANFSPDPYAVNVTAGGPLAAERLGGPDCVGTIAEAPDVRLNYRADSLPLYISATSRADITLVVNLPDGSWACSDDFQGTDPGLVFRSPQSGQYDIWIGHFDRGSRVPAQLRISEVPPR